MTTDNMADTPKHCGGCDRDLPRDAFATDRSKGDGLVSRCRECDSARKRAHREANLDAERARCRESSRESMRKRRARPEVREQERAYRATREGREAAARAKHARRARVADVYTEPVDVAALFAAYNYACVYCGDPAEAIEHFEPIADGGPHAERNLVIACTPCNSSKRDRSPYAFLRDRLGAGVFRRVVVEDPCTGWRETYDFDELC